LEEALLELHGVAGVGEVSFGFSSVHFEALSFPAISSILFNAPKPSNAPIQPKNQNCLKAL
jgi:hypothetical protein